MGPGELRGSTRAPAGLWGTQHKNHEASCSTNGSTVPGVGWLVAAGAASVRCRRRRWRAVVVPAGCRQWGVGGCLFSWIRFGSHFDTPLSSHFDTPVVSLWYPPPTSLDRDRYHRDVG
nr:MAG TPA: hypothetical protein [Caudoviricetes sp.]